MTERFHVTTTLSQIGFWRHFRFFDIIKIVTESYVFVTKKLWQHKYRQLKLRNKHFLRWQLDKLSLYVTFSDNFDVAATNLSQKAIFLVVKKRWHKMSWWHRCNGTAGYINSATFKWVFKGVLQAPVNILASPRSGHCCSFHELVFSTCLMYFYIYQNSYFALSNSSILFALTYIHRYFLIKKIFTVTFCFFFRCPV